MAEKKKTASVTADKNKKQKSKKSAAPQYKKTDKKASVKEPELKIKTKDPETAAKSPLNQLLPYGFAVLALLGIVCHLLIDVFGKTDSMGFIGLAYRNLMCGLFGWGAYLVPVILIYLAFFWKKNILDLSCGIKAICACIVLLLITALVETSFIEFGGAPHTYNPIELYKRGADLVGGGAIGGFIGALFYVGLKFIGTLIVSLSIIIVLTLFLLGLTPKDVWLYIRYKIKLRQRRKAESAIIGEQVKLDIPEKKKPSAVIEEIPVSEPAPKKKKKTVDIPLDDEIVTAETDDFDNPTDPEIFDEVLNEVGNAYSDTEHVSPIAKDKGGEGEIDLSKIFVNPDAEIKEDISENADLPDSAETEISVEKRKITELPVEKAAPVPEPEPEPEYVFPPLSLLKEDDAHQNAEAAQAELRANAERLVEVLASFNVKTKITNVSRGPTITRYELLPEAGTRVKAIANLVDDISLGLAASGVRIEAPIPGKAAVGVEVPNKAVSTVYVRSLIENEKFKSHPSKLNACLGADVAGTPIFCDVAKMPHMLIAGATGMGKSVCINSIIISLLYKSTPDEVKFILIDPKKVEFNLYNGIPHLLVPVVSDPKKAAGALHWAVTEMERRFELIESVGVRDIKNYNAVTRDDPEKEFMPQIVIIIDELADLMMTAPDEVEDSICRIAQKARAAGMHLIIGTQRPSVDVITGLIKANVPSRIACKVASQTDSRVIFDMAGAEKLIGRGDMLYAPVGAMKPIRVQGAFVSDAEVEAVTEFIRQSAGNAEYSREVIERIEKEAAACGKKGSGAASIDEGDGESDPMLRPAIELAIESGKISTSLIQRRLSLGYGRAAKLIDRMQELGFVSAPEGQKPREVLITRQQYMEMVVRDEDAIE